jgi:replication factor C subunit 2/4
LRYSKLTQEQVLECLLKVSAAEKLSYTDDGLEAILFTADGDMRNALNNLQAAHALSNSTINQAAVFKVCDQPHPKTVGEILEACSKGNTKLAVHKMNALWKLGYSASDIIGTIFKVCKAMDMPEALKLEYLRLVGFTHMRISDGLNSQLQLLGLVGRLSQKAQ